MVAIYFQFSAQAKLMKGKPYKAAPFSLIFFYTALQYALLVSTIPQGLDSSPL